MSGYVTVNRLSLVQLLEEERKHRAHLRKIDEMQRRSGIDNKTPTYFPQVKKNSVNQTTGKRKEIEKANDAKSKKLLNIMASKTNPSPAPFRPANPNRYNQSVRLLQSNADYVERIAKTKSIYDAREWRKGFEEHQEHLKISKDNKLFTPRDMGANRQRIKAASTTSSSLTTPTASFVNIQRPI